MTMNDIDETQPVQAGSPEDHQPNQDIKPPRKFRWWYILVGILIMFLGAGVGTYLGYQEGLKIRRQAQSDQVVMLATQQFQMGVLDLEAGRFAMARQRFEFVISVDPSFPQAAEKLAEAMMRSSQVLTPTPAPTPTLEPTPDLRGEEELFDQIRQHLNNQQWSDAVETIQKLRDRNLEYRAVDVDGMYYIALRYLGVEYILNRGQLEVGIYNLALAERFAPLDVEAMNYRTWARLYISAASFWGVDWAQVVIYFADIYPALPNLRDASGMTATERYRIGSIRYGDWLMLQERYCDAETQYRNALNISNDLAAQSGLTQAADYCANPPNEEGEEEEEPTAEVTPTPTEEGAETPPVETVEPTPGG